MQGHTRILQPNYLPQKHKEEFETLVDKFKIRLGRKVNETLVYRKAMEPSQADQEQMSFDDPKRRRRNLSTFSSVRGAGITCQSSISPTVQHVSRIRNCY